MNKYEFNGILLSEIEIWADVYDFNFQFWGKDNNNVYISKGHVDLYDTGGCETIPEALKAALSWIYEKNQVPTKERAFQEA